MKTPIAGFIGMVGSAVTHDSMALRGLLVCGILYSPLYVAMNTLAAR
jgi:hypothetical protein